MRIASEGWREILIAGFVLGAGAVGAGLWTWPAAVPFVAVWLGVLAFFRDPRRENRFEPGALCSPADGTITEITELHNGYGPITRPAVRIGMFLSLFNVHVNRAPCSGKVRSVTHKPGEFLDARRPDSSERNESNTLVIDPPPPMPGPVVVRQVTGFLARRIVCHARPGQILNAGERFGLIKFGSRTELILPQGEGLQIRVKVGDRVRAGLTILASYKVAGKGTDTEEETGRVSERCGDWATPAVAAADVASGVPT